MLNKSHCFTFSMLCMCIAITSSQKFTRFDKQYFVIKQFMTFDEAISICKNRNERLVQIKTREENDFILKTIVKRLGADIWLGATNIIGTNTYKWLDGSDVTNFGLKGANNAVVNERNALHMSGGGGWFDTSVKSLKYVLCENIPLETTTTTELTQQTTKCSELINKFDGFERRFCNLSQEIIEFKESNSMKFDTQSSVINRLQDQTNDLMTELEIQKQQTKVNQQIGFDEKRWLEVKTAQLNKLNQFNSSIVQLNQQLMDVFSNSSSMLRGELLNEIEHRANIESNRVAEIYSNKFDQLNDVIQELKSQANDNAFEVQFQKQQSSQLISNLNTDADKSKKLIEHLESQVKMNKEKNDLLVQRNELLEMRLTRIEQKMSTNIVDNSNKRDG